MTVVLQFCWYWSWWSS